MNNKIQSRLLDHITQYSYIAIHKLTKRYNGVPAVEDISCTIAKGSVVAIIGPNGSGKTTLVKMLLGLLPPTSGSVTIDGRRPEATRRQIGYVPQRITFNNQLPMRVDEFLRLSLHVAGFHDREAAAIIHQRLADVGLISVDTKQLHELSGGQLQRVMIARAMLTDKAVLFLDEPAAGIDIEGQQSIYELIIRLNKERNTTIVLVSHELDVVFRYASQVVCINRRMVCQGVPREAITAEVLQQMYSIDTHALYQHAEKVDQIPRQHPFHHPHV